MLIVSTPFSSLNMGTMSFVMITLGKESLILPKGLVS